MEYARPGDTVRVHYTGKLDDGTVFDTSYGGDPIEFQVGSTGIISGFHQAVQGMKAGDSKTERIASHDAYGPYEPSLRVDVDRALFSAEGVNPRVGMELEVNDGAGNTVPVRVADVADTRITLDANHPLAGKDLIFDISVVEVIKNGADRR